MVSMGSFTSLWRIAPIACAPTTQIDWLLEQEDVFNTPRPYRDFRRVFRHRQDLVRPLRALVADGKTVLGYGPRRGQRAPPVLGLSPADIPASRRREPGLAVSRRERTSRSSRKAGARHAAGLLLVPPWHFREGTCAARRISRSPRSRSCDVCASPTGNAPAACLSLGARAQEAHQCLLQ
jgi:hypothetical protein